ncbi:MAG: flagellar biosynthesis protein FlgD, partial [Pirellulaceae bacterium]|nr:flagellar biosynthesis protein FlgD [Pirellulaceae bacterium]
MTSIPGTSSTNSTGGSTSTGTTTGNDLRNVDLNQFLTLLVTEMQNQDPLNPMDNSQLLTQISQIREIGSTNQLTETLSSLATGQGLTMASGLIGKTVSALDDGAKEINGVVDKVSVTTDPQDNSKRTVKVHIGSSTVDINNIREINQPSR